ncbi:hypothetical protein WPS_29720 [Vulcanimicrobium alpinum]|uniref:DUF1003 domain-containing protein n=1 Tax=Vulcanimicrobium alpinum TaxID=3016050 RepID=A0AAN1XYF2_UNVUL|nr:DUF1003 domain-containing protein [Vulcanimicrobium alpinum]BDE07696.1 hypothetical protein WPS_29720 [Vulcanimicrobium alpinum]
MNLEADAVDQTIDSIAELERRALSEASQHARAIERATLAIGRPRTLYTAMTAIFTWIAANLMLIASGRPPLDAPPFYWLDTAVTISAFLTTIMILVSANRSSTLDEQRDRLSLQIALLTDRKTAKLIALIEELRRDMPTVPNRTDAEAVALSQSTDPHAVTAELEKRTPNRSEVVP